MRTLQRKDRKISAATRFKYCIHLKCRDEHQASPDHACRDNSIGVNSYTPSPTLSKYRSNPFAENRHSKTDSSDDDSNCGSPRFFIPQWQADSKNKTDKTKAHYDRDVRTILEKWQSDSIFVLVNHAEGLYDTVIPLYTNVVYNLARSDPRGIAKSHLMDLQSYNKVVRLWHKFRRDKAMGRYNYPNISNIYTRILDLEPPHNRRVSEFMEQTEARLTTSINAQCVNVHESRSGHRSRYYDTSSIFKYFMCRPQQILQIKDDRYDDGLLCKRLFFESNNNAYIIARIDEKTTEILKRIISDEYETISKTLKEYQEGIETINQLANQFREEIGSIMLFADNLGIKGKCLLGI